MNCDFCLEFKDGKCNVGHNVCNMHTYYESSITYDKILETCPDFMWYNANRIKQVERKEN